MSDTTPESTELPAELVAVDTNAATVTLAVDATIYPLQALYGASYIFIDRCFVFIDRPEEGRFRVVLSPKDAKPEPEALRALVGEFANELLSCAWRHQITQDNRVAIETVTMQAIAGAMGEPSLDDLAAFDFSDEAFDDPLGIAQSWEEKHGKKTPSEPPPADAGDEPRAAAEQPAAEQPAAVSDGAGAAQ
ncbi:MAG: His-Xaa-Ser system protein HxsD [Myxococcales bacterium]|nr:His-Xaa-Ser system protein HxsD [Myxococcales bacterium]MCB9754691.1 His-Xaa-Ser system protein HxsD [Myxococcales bacterium]